MKSVLIFFIVLCALFSPLLPFLPIPIILYNNLDTNVSESKPEENNQNNNDVEIDITSEAEEEKQEKAKSGLIEKASQIQEHGAGQQTKKS